MKKTVRKAWLRIVCFVWAILWIEIFRLVWKGILIYFTNWPSEVVMYSSWGLAIIGGILMLILNYKDVARWAEETDKRTS